MKKLMPIALCLVLLLSGCGLSEQIAAVREEYIDPAIERADSGNLDQPESDSVLTGPNISTDRSLISDVPVYEPLYSRAQEGYMSVLEEGWSGTLLPIGSGLATSEGEIVLDPVLASATPAVCTVEGEEYTLQIYILENSEGMFAACSAYGDWVTDFAYTEIIPFELGVLCISDAEANLAVCYSSEGEVLFDTADFSARGQLAPGSVASLAQYGSGYMLCEYANGQWGFLSTDGTFLNRDSDLPSYFDGASPFSNGLAAVCQSAGMEEMEPANAPARPPRAGGRPKRPGRRTPPPPLRATARGTGAPRAHSSRTSTKTPPACSGTAGWYNPAPKTTWA